MLIKIIDCDHGEFEPEIAAAKKAGVKLEIGQCKTKEEMIAFGKDADAILVQRLFVDRHVLEALPKCKVVGRYGSGVDNVDLEAAKARGVKVVYTPYFCFVDVANHALAMILALTRRIPFISNEWKADPAQFNAKYDQRVQTHTRGVARPTEQTLGIVGFGKIGSEVAKRARVFGFNVIAYDPYVSSQWMTALGVQKIDALDELLSKADVLTFHCPLTEETRKILNATGLAKMKKGSILVNCSRGPVVDEEAVADALENGTLSCAGMDVFEVEPPAVKSRFYKMKNVMITPHVAFYSDQSFHDLKDRIVRYAANALTGKGDYEAVV